MVKIIIKNTQGEEDTACSSTATATTKTENVNDDQHPSNNNHANTSAASHDDDDEEEESHNNNNNNNSGDHTKGARQRRRRQRQRQGENDNHKKTNDGNEVTSHQDQGHRYGNFHNYYTFHPTNERMKLLGQDGGILDYIASRYHGNDDCEATTKTKEEKFGPSSPKKTKLEESGSSSPLVDSNRESTTKMLDFGYLDVGCNEGDLTMEVAKELAHRLCSSRRQHLSSDASSVSLLVRAKGIDIDPVLISRAKQKYSSSSSSAPTAAAAALTQDSANNNTPPATMTPQIQASFQAVDVLSKDDNTLERIMNDKSQQKQQVHLTSIFSTTMWIHIHGGDDGLSRFLETICRNTTRFIIIEAQPSKWYGRFGIL